MKHIFPIEILEDSTHLHWFKRHSQSKMIYRLIIIVLIVVMISLPFIYVDVSSQSPATIRTPQENNVLQSMISAQIIKTNLSENQYVSKGDTLLWLKSDELEEQIRRLKQKLEENSLYIQDINLLLFSSDKSFTLWTGKYAAEKLHFDVKVNEHIITLRQSEAEYLTSKALYEKGVEAKYEYIQMRSKYESSKMLLESMEKQQYSLWQAEKARLERENKDLASELSQQEKRGDNYYIIAPISGNIVQYIGLQTGNFLSPSQTIAYITAEDNLIAESYVSPSDIGYIRTHQKVKLQMEAFNYQQWGLVEGEVSEVLTDIVQIDNKPYFRVRCSLAANHLSLKNGYRGYLKKGMSGTARFFITRRSIAELLFDKVDNWLNPKIIANGN